jgi:hypothetical protein
MARPVPIAGDYRLNRLKGENGHRDRYRLLHPVFAERLRAHQDRAEAEEKRTKAVALAQASQRRPTVKESGRAGGTEQACNCWTSFVA